MLVSTNRTIVHLVAVQPVGGAELADIGLDLPLQPGRRLSPSSTITYADTAAHRRGPRSSGATARSIRPNCYPIGKLTGRQFTWAKGQAAALMRSEERRVGKECRPPALPEY